MSAIRVGGGEDRIGWDEFVARFYPHSRRHDFDVLAAYESYAAEVRAGSTPAEETERWEGEGGSVAERPQRVQMIREGPPQGPTRMRMRSD